MAEARRKGGARIETASAGYVLAWRGAEEKGPLPLVIERLRSPPPSQILKSSSKADHYIRSELSSAAFGLSGQL
jgi:hypothetical protein